MKRIRVGLAAGLVAALGALVASGGVPASAAVPLIPGTVEPVTVGSTDQVLGLQVDRLVPGSGTSARFLVQRGRFSGGSFGVRVDDVDDLERGCGRPERSSGDVTCGDADGELSQQLLVAAGWSVPTDCARAAAPSGGLPMAAVAGQALLAPVGTDRLDAVCLVLALQLPVSADNLVQGDAVRFRLRLGLDLGGTPRPGSELVTSPGSGGELPDVAVSAQPDEASDAAAPGSAALSGGAGGAAVLLSDTAAPTPAARGIAELRPSALPFTGGRPGGLLFAALCCAVGASLAVAGRRPRPTAPPPADAPAVDRR